ncbi:MAG: DEAD/DEAH box helicase, partial [Chloroflexota bacterium]
MAKAPAPPPPPTDPVELLSTPLAGSGLAAGTALRRAGIKLDFYTVRDLLFHLPRRYDDLREMRTLDQLAFEGDGTVVSAQARVADVRVEPGFRGRTQRTIARLEDDTGSIDATWFGRRFIERRLLIGGEVVVSGKVKHFGRRLTLDNPEFQVVDGESELLHAGRIVPVYPLTAGLTAIRLRSAIREALDRAGHAYPEYLPASITREEGLVPIGQAIEEAHYPDSFEGRDAALRRLAFDELLALQLGMVARRRQRVRDAAPQLVLRTAADASVRTALADALSVRVGYPVELTRDQAAAMTAIRDDLAKPTPMLRLLQGDVGSGKTAVAAYALAAAARPGFQGALLAPTDLLARQHLETIGALLEGVGIGVTLLTGSLKADVKAKALEAIASGQALVVVGTHALIQESVSFANLGLVVIDEQHRFGVDQRGQLEAKAGGRSPHVLLMTATPIPRTLGQVLYADLDVSDLRTPPAGRVEIQTGVKRPADLEGTWRKVREEAALGHRTFVVVPLIDESADETDRAAAAESEAVRLAALLDPLRVGMVHGRLKPAERDAEMSRFR